METAKELLKNIKKNDLRIKRLAPTSDAKPEDMHNYGIRANFSDNTYQWKIFHEKCRPKAQLELEESGYILTRLNQITVAGAMCNACGQLLDPAKRAEQVKSNFERINKKKKAYERWVEDQILLGNM